MKCGTASAVPFFDLNFISPYTTAAGIADETEFLLLCKNAQYMLANANHMLDMPPNLQKL